VEEEESAVVEVRRVERRRISSSSSVGRVAVCFEGSLNFEVVLLVFGAGAERSRVLSAVRKSWAFAARFRAALRACTLLEMVGGAK